MQPVPGQHRSGDGGGKRAAMVGLPGSGPFPTSLATASSADVCRSPPAPQRLWNTTTPPPPPHGPRSPPKPCPPRRAAAPHRAANRGAAAPSGGGGRGMRGSGGGCLCMWGGVSVPQPSRGWQVTRNCKNIPPFSFRRLLRSEEP